MMPTPFPSFPFLQGLSFAITSVVPDALLSDVIDYDELHAGTRREGMYVVLETTVGQLMEIVGDTGRIRTHVATALHT